VKGHKGFPYGLLKQRRLTEPIEKDFLPLTGLQIVQFESTWSQEFQHPFELSLEIVSEREYELELGKINLCFFSASTPTWKFELHRD